MPDSQSLPMIIAMVCLIAGSALFSATETAFNTFNRVRMKNLASDGDKRAALVLRLSDDYDALLTTILIGNNIVNIALTAIATVMFVAWFPHNGAAISTAVTTVLVLVFGEVSPKSIAKESPDGFAKAIAPLMRLLMILFKPLTFFFRMWKKLLAKLFKLDGAQAMTEEELITIVDEVQEDGGINETEGELIRSVIEFDDAEVADVITPRVDVVAIDKDTPFEEIADLFFRTGFSRLPVYDETIDTIVGVLHEKEFYHRCIRDGETLAAVLNKPFLVPCHMKISKLLEKFREAKAQLAIVLDDYGGMMGIVTLEDVIEELVGDIWDEHDEVVELFTAHDDGSVSISGDARMSDVFDYFDIEPENEDELPQTVSGWVTMVLGEFPEAGVTFDADGLHVEITQVSERLVGEIRVTKLPEAASDEEE